MLKIYLSTAICTKVNYRNEVRTLVMTRG